MFLCTKWLIQLLHNALKSTSMIWYIILYVMLKYMYQLHPLIYCWYNITRNKKLLTHSLTWPHARILPAGTAILAQKLDLNLLQLKQIWKRASEKQLCVLTLSSFNKLHFEVFLWVTSIGESNIYTHSDNSQITWQDQHQYVVHFNPPDDRIADKLVNSISQLEFSFMQKFILFSLQGSLSYSHTVWPTQLATTKLVLASCSNTGGSLCNLWLQHTVTSRRPHAVIPSDKRTIIQMPVAESLYLPIIIAAEMSFFFTEHAVICNTKYMNNIWC